MKPDFVAIDVETANADMASICQIGAANFSSGKVVSEWVTYVNPRCEFSWVNMSIHGITDTMVAEAPTFREIADRLKALLVGNVVITHTAFDRLALQQANSACGTVIADCTWLDTARVARRTWLEYSRRGYGLRNICDIMGYKFKHHDALEDAKASGEILLAAIARTGLSVEDWLVRAKLPIDASLSDRIERAGNPSGPLAGEVLVFTGALSLPRRMAADLGAQLGCEVDGGVTKRTTLLVVGDQDVFRLNGHETSTKHRKAEELISKGQPIRILRETDFRALTGGAY